MSIGPGVIALWSPPRCRSTAFLRMVIQRGDMLVVHEPFSHRADFGMVEIDGQTIVDEADLIIALLRLGRRTPVFFKDTTDFHYPGVLRDKHFLREVVHTFLIRDPREAIASHYALDPDVSCEAIGFSRLLELYKAVAQVSERPPVLLDSADLVANPAATVRAYCEALGIPFYEDHLRWDRGPRPEWERSARWHTEVSDSTSFGRERKTYEVTVDNDRRLAGYYAFHFPYYMELRSHRLVVEEAASGTPQ